MKTPFLLAMVAASSVPADAPHISADGKPIDIAAPPERLDSISKRKCDRRTKSGLGYRILREGSGGRPTEDATVKVGYSGYLLSDGSRFDNGPSAEFPVKGVIPGFGEGATLMNRGAQYRLCIPSRLGYGERGAGSVIPPGANLIFIVEMIDF